MLREWGSVGLHSEGGRGQTDMTIVRRRKAMLINMGACWTWYGDRSVLKIGLSSFSHVLIHLLEPGLSRCCTLEDRNIHVQLQEHIWAQERTAVGAGGTPRMFYRSGHDLSRMSVGEGQIDQKHLQ